MGARQKLNVAYLNGCLIFAAIIGGPPRAVSSSCWRSLSWSWAAMRAETSGPGGGTSR